MVIDENKIIRLLDDYLELEEEIKVLIRTEGMSQDILKESQKYRNFSNIGHEIEGYALNGREIIKIYGHLKNNAEQEYNFKEEEYKFKINDLEEVVSNLKDSKNNLRKLILDSNNFFNGKIIDEIKND